MSLKKIIRHIICRMAAIMSRQNSNYNCLAGLCKNKMGWTNCRTVKGKIETVSDLLELILRDGHLTYRDLLYPNENIENELSKRSERKWIFNRP